MDELEPQERKSSLPRGWAEAVIVVLFIAITGAIAGPPLWQRHLKRVMVDEAKTNLSGIFTAEKSFFGEYMTYGTDLVSVNWQPEGAPRFVYGFCSEFPKNPLPGLDDAEYDRATGTWVLRRQGWFPERKHTAHPGVLGATAPPWPRYSPERHSISEDPCTVLTRLGLAHLFTVNGQTFQAFAVANLDLDADLEVWAIDHVKNLQRLMAD